MKTLIFPCPSGWRLSISTSMTKSGKRRIFRCGDCATAFSETRDTVFFDLRTPAEKVIMTLKMVLVGVDLTGLAFVLSVTEETTLEWLARAAAKARQINDSLLLDLPVTQVQLDEMWHCIRRKHASADGDGESLPEAADGRQWACISCAPEYRLMLTAVVGPCTLETAKGVIEATAAIVRAVPGAARHAGPVASREMFFIKQVEWACCVLSKRRNALKPVALV